MEHQKSTCPVCGSKKLMMKYEASYVYSYAIDSNVPGAKNISVFLPYLYDSREQTDTRQYIECSQCGTQVPCYFHEQNNEFNTRSVSEVLQQHGQINNTACHK